MKRNGRHRLEPYTNRLFGYAYSLMGDREVALELVQDCVVKALAAARTPREEPAYRAWLFRILRNAAIDRMRRSGVPTVPLDEEPDLPEMPGWRVEDSLINRMTVHRGLGALGRDHREIISLVDIAGFSYAEAASLLEVPQGTVMSRLSRARRALLAALSEDNVHSLPLIRKRSRA